MDYESLKKAGDRIKKTIVSKILISIKNILEMDFGEEKWFIDQLIPIYTVTAITGKPGSYKSWLTLEIARCASEGTKFLDYFQCMEGSTLIIDKENHFRHIKDRINKLQIKESEIYYYNDADEFFIDNEKNVSRICECVKENNIKLVIFDSLIRMHNGNENDSKDITKVMNAFRKIANSGTNVIFIHHNRKERDSENSTTNSVRGSTDIFAGIDCLIQINQLTKDTLKISQTKSRQGVLIDSFKVKITNTIIDDVETIKFTYGGIEVIKSQMDRISMQILAHLNDKQEISRQEIIDLFPVDTGTHHIDRSIKELEREKKIILETRQHNKHYYRLKS